jgi:hypothetical protein
LYLSSSVVAFLKPKAAMACSSWGVVFACDYSDYAKDLEILTKARAL